MKEFFRAVKFLLFSISAGVIELATEELLSNFTSLGKWACYFIGLFLSVLWNFTLNRKFTFKSAANVPIAMLKTFAFYLVFTPLSLQLQWILTEKYGWLSIFPTLINMVLNFVLEFLYQRFFVFRNSIDTAKNKNEPKNS